ncbi:MAG: ABC transporter ATP-binding protein [Rhizobiaceae bacterium]|nr:ABC transporter ATP-binding protein [Rhizobiaceae bacterium]
MLEVRNLSVSYGQHRALDGATLRVARGEIVVILGANGAGKTSLLKAICGISEGHVSGSVSMNGEQLVGMKPNKIVETGLALVPEGRGVFGDLTVAENLMLGAYTERARDEEDANLEQVFALFPKLAERRRQVVRTMSGGEQQMVAVGRAMMSNPAILALDEPSLGLSPLLCKDLFHSLLTVKEAGIGILLVEQNAKQSLRVADRGYLLENATIVHEDTASALINDPAIQKAYLGGAAAGARAPARPRPAQVPSTPAIRAPTPATPAPAASTAAQRRPAGPSPSDIAAAALRGIDSRQRPVPASPAPAPASHAPAAHMPSPAPAPAAAFKSNGAGSPGPAPTMRLPDTGDLVARAAAMASRKPAASRPNGSSVTAQPSFTRPPATRSPSPRPQVAVTEPGSSGDRLQTILAEIEAAARRAETYSQNRKDPRR